jgi:hypothetical protein
MNLSHAEAVALIEVQQQRIQTLERELCLTQAKCMVLGNALQAQEQALKEANAKLQEALPKPATPDSKDDTANG